MQTKTQLEDLQNYLTDASNMPGGHAEKLFVPESVSDICEILRDANERKIPVTVSGARTGTVGGAIPFGGWVISLEKLNRIKSIDKENRTAVVEPGVILADLQKAVDAEGLFYPPDPTEWSCQVGGTVATDASGARSFKYGATRNYVARLRVVLATGEILDLRRDEYWADHDTGDFIVPTVGGREITGKASTLPQPNVTKNVSGYYSGDYVDVIDLFIGSEGTLGIVVEAELFLLPKPKSAFSGIVFFNGSEELIDFVSAVKRENKSTKVGGPLVTPSLIEYFDARALKFISEKFPETPEDSAGAIYFEQETTAETEDRLFERWNELLEKHNADLDRSWFTTADQDREKMRAFRHALPVSVNERVVRNKQKKIGTDMAVPDEKFPGFLKYQKEMLDASGIDYVIFGHIGDCHLHANLLPKNDEEAERARHIYGRFIAQAIMLGGCVSAEHGIGKLKRKYLNAMMGERYLNEMIEIKRAFDPNFILGRGNMFETTENS
jgi:D-lactate dehydrogenase (cytochrome)